MSDYKNLARYYKVDIETAPGVWSALPGLYDLQPKIDSTKKDDSDYDSDGWGSDVKTMQKWSLELSINRLRDTVTDAHNVAQEALREAAALFDEDATVKVRWYDKKGGPEAYEGTAMVEWERANGSTEDLDGAKITLSGQGARINLGTVGNPINVSAKPVLVDLSDTTVGTAGGALVRIRGNHFADVTAVKVAATDAVFFVNGPNEITFITPVKTAASYNVTLVNPTGTSDVVSPAGVLVYS